MKKAITVGIDEKGTAKVLADPDTPFDEQRKKFAAMRNGALPKGIESIELYVREAYTFGLDGKAQKVREAGHVIDIDGNTYPPEVYSARVAWRAKNAADRAEAERNGKPYIPKTKIPTQLSDIKGKSKSEPTEE